MSNTIDKPGFYHERQSGKYYKPAGGTGRWEQYNKNYEYDGTIDSLPPGDYVPLTPAATDAEAREEFRIRLLQEWPFTPEQHHRRAAEIAAEVFGRVERREAEEPSEQWFAEHGFEYDDEMEAWVNYLPVVNNKKWPVMFLEGRWQIGTTVLHSESLEWRDWAVHELSDTHDLENDSDAELRRKLEMVITELAKVANAETEKIAAVTEKLEKYKAVLIRSQDFCAAAAVKDCLQLLNGFEPKPLKMEADQITTLQETIKRLEGEVKSLEVERDEVIRKFRVAATPAPEVIEGKGQRVGELAGWFWYDDSGFPTPVYKDEGDKFASEVRYIRVEPPTFPPRVPFTPPPKPEQHLIRWHRIDGTHVDMWATKHGDAWRGTEDGCTYTRVELLNPETGEVLK